MGIFQKIKANHENKMIERVLERLKPCIKKEKGIRLGNPIETIYLVKEKDNIFHNHVQSFSFSNADININKETNFEFDSLANYSFALFDEYLLFFEMHFASYDNVVKVYADNSVSNYFIICLQSITEVVFLDDICQYIIFINYSINNESTGIIRFSCDDLEKASILKAIFAPKVFKTKTVQDLGRIKHNSKYKFAQNFRRVK